MDKIELKSYILAFDTTNSSLSIALLQNREILQKVTIEENGIQSQKIIVIFEEILNQNGIWYQDLKLITYTSGPGSFTGIRIGLAVAKALQITTNILTKSFNSLEIIAYKYFLKYGNDLKSLTVAIDARSEEIFIADFIIDNWELKMINSASLIKIDKIGDYFQGKQDIFLAGSAKNIIFKLFENKKIKIDEEEQDIIEADLIGLYAQEEFNKSRFINDADIQQAIYLRNPKVSKRKK
jgi:tRNA threonylcarbamoyl adenosine modification protein YeaZ